MRTNPMLSNLRPLAAKALCLTLVVLGGCAEEAKDPAEDQPATTPSVPKTPGDDTDGAAGSTPRTEAPQAPESPGSTGSETAGTGSAGSGSPPETPETPGEATTEAPTGSESTSTPQNPAAAPDENPLQATIKVEERAKPVEERNALPPNAVVRLFDAFGNAVQTASGLYRVADGKSLPIRSGNISLRVDGKQRVVFSVDGCTTVSAEISEGLNTLNVRPAPIVLFTIEDALPKIAGGAWQLVGKVRDPDAVAGPSLRAVPITSGRPTQWPLRDLGLDFECALIPDPRASRSKPLPSISVPVRGPADLDAQLQKALPGARVRLQLDAEAIAEARRLGG